MRCRQRSRESACRLLLESKCLARRNWEFPTRGRKGGVAFKLRQAAGYFEAGSPTGQASEAHVTAGTKSPEPKKARAATIRIHCGGRWPAITPTMEEARPLSKGRRLQATSCSSCNRGRQSQQ